MRFSHERLDVCKMITVDQNHRGKVLLDRIVAMLTKMGGRGYSVKESEAIYSVEGNVSGVDGDNDCESDSEKT